MAKTQAKYEGYCEVTPTILVKEKFGNVNIYTKNTQSVLNKASGFISAYDFTLNPYRGCQYGCSYCYAVAFSPNPPMRQDWGNWVIVKQNAAEVLEKELQKWYEKNSTRPPSIYMSSVTDPYQPIEAKEKLTRCLLEVMVKYQPTLVIQTRSPMITRDIDLLQQFHRLRINMSVPTGSERVRRDFEPRSPSIFARLRAIGILKHILPCNADYDTRFSVTMTPLLPTLEADIFSLISKVQVVDRVVIQEFHASHNRTLVASTRPEALEITKKYAWWYDNEKLNYLLFRDKLITMLPDIEIKEGQAGFGYD
jgi:DNA repair photolyase